MTEGKFLIERRDTRMVTSAERIAFGTVRTMTKVLRGAVVVAVVASSAA